MNLDQIVALFNSKNPKAWILGFLLSVFFLFPSIARAMDDETLSLWKRAEVIMGGIGQLFGAVVLVGLNSKQFTDEDSDRPTVGPPE